jgi:hypothetical protein
MDIAALLWSLLGVAPLWCFAIWYILARQLTDLSHLKGKDDHVLQSEARKQPSAVVVVISSEPDADAAAQVLDWYRHEIGVTTVFCAPPFFSGHGLRDKYTSVIMEALQKRAATTDLKRVFIHVIGFGGCPLMYRLIDAIMATPLRQTLRGMVFDSAPNVGADCVSGLHGLACVSSAALDRLFGDSAPPPFGSFHKFGMLLLSPIIVPIAIFGYGRCSSSPLFRWAQSGNAVLVLSSASDPFATTALLSHTLRRLKSSSVSVSEQTWAEGAHARLYAKHKGEYQAAVRKFYGLAVN